MNLDLAGSHRAGVPHDDAQHGRPPDLDLRRGDLLDDHLRALGAFKLLAARLAGAAGRRSSFCRIVRQGIADRAGKIRVPGIGRGQTRTWRDCSRGRGCSGGWHRILVLRRPRGNGIAVGRCRHELGFDRGNAHRAARVSGISAGRLAIGHETNPCWRLVLAALRRTAVARCRRSWRGGGGADSRPAARPYRRVPPHRPDSSPVPRWPRAAAARYAADWTTRRPAAHRARSAGRGRLPTAPGRQLFQVWKFEKQCVSLRMSAERGSRDCMMRRG